MGVLDSSIVALRGVCLHTLRQFARSDCRVAAIVNVVQLDVQYSTDYTKAPREKEEERMIYNKND